MQARVFHQPGPLEKVLVHSGGVFAFKGIGEHVSVSSVCMASLSTREQYYIPSEESAKVQKLEPGGELQACTFVHVPHPNTEAKSSNPYHIFQTISGMDAEEEYKTNYMDINWT